MSKLTFTTLVRQNTGSHCMDSGGANGRHWQRPAIKKDSWLSFYEYKDGEFDVSASLNLVSFLDAHLEIDQKLTKKLHATIKKQTGPIYYSGAAELLADLTGLKVINSDNSYNHDNDLTQDIQFSAVSDQDEWYFSDKTLIVLETHNGADIRGGYSDYVVCKPLNDDMSGFFDQVCGISILSGKDSSGKVLDREACQALDEKFQVGYTSNPSYAFSKQVAKVLTKKKKSGEYDKLTVLLKTGETVVVCVNPRLDY